MGALKEYKTTVNGAETTLLLSDEEAKTRGLSGGKARATVAETPELNTDTGAEAREKAAQAANKARAAQNK